MNDKITIRSLSDLRHVDPFAAGPARPTPTPRPVNPGMSGVVGQNRVPGREGRIIQVRTPGGEWKDSSGVGQGIELRYVEPRLPPRAKITF